MGKIGMLAAGVLLLIFAGPPIARMAIVSWKAEPKPVMPQQAAGPGQTYRGVPLGVEDKPRAETVATGKPVELPMPAANRQQGNGQQLDPLVVARLSDFGASGGGNAAPPPQRQQGREPAARADTDIAAVAGQQTPLAKELTPTAFASSRATEVADPRFTIEQGTQIPCKDQTAIDTSYPGGVTALIGDDVYGATGDVKLLDAGSKAFGTIEHGLVNGLDRGFVLWNQITGPVVYDAHGVPRQVRVVVNSPAADEMGRTGLAMEVDRHTWQKLSGIIGLSLIQGGLQIATAAAGSGGGGGGNALNFNTFQQGGDQAANTLLAANLQIPDVGKRAAGLPCSIALTRDLVFSDIYGLRVR